MGPGWHDATNLDAAAGFRFLWVYALVLAPKGASNERGKPFTPQQKYTQVDLQGPKVKALQGPEGLRAQKGPPTP